MTIRMIVLIYVSDCCRQNKNFLKKTVHAGEDYGPESIFQAITDLHADRIGHGVHLFNGKMIQDPEIVDKEAYIENLVQFIADAVVRGLRRNGPDGRLVPGAEVGAGCGAGHGDHPAGGVGVIEAGD